MSGSDTDVLHALIGALEAPSVKADFVGRALERPFKPAGGRLRYAEFLLPVGTLFVAFDDAVLLSQVGGHGINFEGRILDMGYQPSRADAINLVIADDTADMRLVLRLALTEEHGFNIVGEAADGREAVELALDATRAIPRGQVRSYSAVAVQIGAPAAARAVGTALARNPVPILIPCHRVVRTDRVLGEYSGGGSEVKARILRWEGIDVRVQRAGFVIA